MGMISTGAFCRGTVPSRCEGKFWGHVLFTLQDELLLLAGIVITFLWSPTSPPPTASTSKFMEVMVPHSGGLLLMTAYQTS